MKKVKVLITCIVVSLTLSSVALVSAATPSLKASSPTLNSTTKNSVVPTDDWLDNSAAAILIRNGGCIQYGDSGEAVSQIQTMLNKVFNANLSVDGDFGPATFNAVEAYQRFQNVTVDGIVGVVTYSCLGAQYFGW
jgi:Putative peptidoglycan-binding domain-containing protein